MISCVVRRTFLIVDQLRGKIMKKNQAAPRRLATALALIALVLSTVMIDAKNTAPASDDEPDFLVLNPERE